MLFCIPYKDHCCLSGSLPYGSCPNSTEQITKHLSRPLQSPTRSLYQYRPTRLSETPLWEDEWYMHSAESSRPGLTQNFQYLCALLMYQREANIKSHSTQRTITGRKCKYLLITDKSWPSRKWHSRNMPAFHLQCFKWRTWTWFNINIFNYPPNTWEKKLFSFRSTWESLLNYKLEVGLYFNKSPSDTSDLGLEKTNPQFGHQVKIKAGTKVLCLLHLW